METAKHAKRLPLAFLFGICLTFAQSTDACSQVQKAEVGHSIRLVGSVDFSGPLPVLIPSNEHCRIPLQSLWVQENTNPGVINDARYFAFLAYEVENLSVRKELGIAATVVVRKKKPSLFLLVSVEALDPLPTCKLECREKFYKGNPYVRDREK